jgi:hypothetical protein
LEDGEIIEVVIRRVNTSGMFHDARVERPMIGIFDALAGCIGAGLAIQWVRGRPPRPVSDDGIRR